MQLKYVILYVDSPRDSIDFFCKAFDLQPGMITPEGDFGEVDTGATTLAFSSLKLMTALGKNPSVSNSKNPCFEVAFTTDDVKGKLTQALNAGAELVQDVKQEAWGQTTAYVSSPDGCLVEICTPVTAPA